MNRIAALNYDSEEEFDDERSSRQPATIEAQESEAFALHTRALVLQKEGDIEDAKEILRDLVNHPLIQQSEHKDGENIGPGQLLKYSSYKNLAVIATQEKKWNDAMDYYQEAVTVDATDVSVWHKMGIIALELHNYPLARHAFEEALICNPRHWPSLDKVITVLYALGDYASCLHFISKALLRDNGYVKGHCFMKQIHYEHPSLQVDTAHFFKDLDSSAFHIDVEQEEIDEFVKEAEDMRRKKRALLKVPERPQVKFSKPLIALSWKDLGECIIDLYDSIDEKMNKKIVTDISKPQVTLTSKVDLSQFKDLSPDQDLQTLNADAPIPAITITEANNTGSSSSTTAKEGPENMDTTQPVSGTDGEGDFGKMEDETADTPSTPGVSLSIKKAPGSKKGPKRKYEWWYNEALKRRSSRVRNTTVKKTDETKIDYGELIKKILPQALLIVGEDDVKAVSPECTDIPNLTDESKMDTGDMPSSHHIEATEKAEVLEFLKSHQTNYGVLELVNHFLFELVKREQLSWPPGLSTVYIKAYDRFRKHFLFPNFLCKDESDEYIHDMAMMCLVFSELKLDSWLSKKNNATPLTKDKCGSFQDHFGEDFAADLEYIVMLSPFQDILAKDWFDFTVRVFWSRARYMVVKNNNNMAIPAFERVVELLNTRNEVSDASKLKLVNCAFDSVISEETAVKHMDTLVCTQSLDEVQKRRSSGDHEHVVKLLLQTFTEKKLSSTKSGGRDEQLLLLQDSLLKLKDYKKCITWLEVSVNEAVQHYLNSHKESNKEVWLSTIAKLTDGLETCLKRRECYKSLVSKSRCRLTENLLKMLEIAMEQPESGGDLVKVTVMPWILLYWLVKHEEDEQKESGNLDQMLLEDDSLEENMPASLMILNLAHEYVSRQSRCTIFMGKLLLFTIDRFSVELASAEDEDEPHPFKEELHNAIEQCFLCLYGHPNKRTKAKHLQDHNAPPVPLSWERCITVFNYFKPKSIPEYDSYRTSGVSAELENLLRRIFQLIPSTCGTSLTVDDIAAYIEGTVSSAPSLEEECKLPVVSELYYLLADYYFKSKEQGKAIKFYMLDLSISPDRFDSWAGMALARSSKLEQKLNSHELKNEPGSINKHSVAALKCFKRALEIDSSNGKLWIEYGSLAYQLHSHASRQLKQQHIFPLGEFLETAEGNRCKMLELARKCYTRAGECETAEDGQEELWLQHYMMGKIGEKMKLKPQQYLQNYRKAAEYLHEDRAKYPKKINYIYSPPHLAVESLEMHFRLHASIIKYLWNNFSNGDDLKRAQVPFDYLENLVNEAAESGFALGVEKDRPKRSAPGESGEAVTCTSSTVAGVGRPRKRSKLHHPDHTYSKAKASSESSQESCDVSSSAVNPQTEAAFMPKSIVIHSPATSGTFPFPTVPSNPEPPTKLIAPMSSTSVSTASTPIPVVAKDSIDDKPKLYDSPPVLTKSESIPELTKEMSDELPDIEKIESSTKPEAMKETSNELPKIDKMESFEEVEMLDELPVIEKMELPHDDEKKTEDDFPVIEEIKPPTAAAEEDDSNDKLLVMKIEEGPNNLPAGELPVMENVDSTSKGLKEEDAQEVSVSEIEPSFEVETGGELSIEKNVSAEKAAHTEPSSKSLCVEEMEYEDEAAAENRETLQDNEKCLIESKSENDEMPVITMEDKWHEEQHNMLPDIEKIQSPKAPENNKQIDEEKNSPMPNLERMETEEFVSEENPPQTTETAVFSKIQLDGAYDDENKKEPSEEKKETDEATDKAMDTEHHPFDNTTRVSADKVKKAEVTDTSVEREKDNEAAGANTVTESNKIKEADLTTKDVKIDAPEKEFEVKTAENISDVKLENPKNDHSGKTQEKEKEAAQKIDMKSEENSVKVKDMEGRYHKLMWRSMQALELCLSRFPQHFKSLYRLALIYAKSDFTKQLQWARDLLLGPQDSWQQLTHMPCPGLFQDRKNTNFFNGLWRIPIEEIDRSGSFTSHLSQSINLLYDVLTELQDNTMLFKLCTQLAKTPEQGKKYLRDLERVYLSRQAYSRCLDVIEQQVSNYKAHPVEVSPDSKSSPDQKFLLHVHKVWRHGISQQIEPKRSNKVFGRAFSAVIKKECNPSESTLPVLLEQAIKYCQELSTVTNPGPGRPKLSARPDEKKKSATGSSSNVTPKRPSTPSRITPGHTSPKPTTAAENYVNSADNGNGNRSDSSYRASEDSESSSSSEDEAEVICISDSPVKTATKMSPGYKSPPLLQGANVPSSKHPSTQLIQRPGMAAVPRPGMGSLLRAGGSPIHVQRSGMGAGQRLPSALLPTRPVSSLAVSQARQVVSASDQSKPPPTESPHKSGDSDDCIILESD